MSLRCPSPFQNDPCPTSVPQSNVRNGILYYDIILQNTCRSYTSCCRITRCHLCKFNFQSRSRPRAALANLATSRCHPQLSASHAKVDHLNLCKEKQRKYRSRMTNLIQYKKLQTKSVLDGIYTLNLRLNRFEILDLNKMHSNLSSCRALQSSMSTCKKWIRSSRKLEIQAVIVHQCSLDHTVFQSVPASYSLNRMGSAVMGVSRMRIS